MRFRVKFGKHAYKRPVTDAKGNVQKNPDGSERRENVIVRAPAVVETDKDLVALFGPGKFERLADGPRGRRGAGAEGGGPQTAAQQMPSGQQAAFPGGQVSSGFQQTSGARGDVGPNSGPVPDDEPPPVAGPLGERPEEMTQQAGKPKGGKGAKPPAAAKPAAYSKEELQGMTVEDLRELAAEEEIPLHGATRKDELVDAIYEGSK
jgi:hypothetical protein